MSAKTSSMWPSSTGGTESARSRVLQLLRFDGPLAKIEIAHRLAVSPATAGSVCEELLREGVLAVAGVSKSASGRPPTLLRLNAHARFMVGCDLGVTHVVSVLTDLLGNVLERSWIATDPRDSVATTLNSLYTSIKNVLTGIGASQDNILGIGLSLPGLMDPVNGISVLAPNLPNWRNVPVVRLVKEIFELPVLMINDAAAMALGEHRFGSGRGHRDLVAVNIGVGIGAGIILNGRLYQGSGGGCGEIGHITVNENGPRCPCGSNGCLELMASGPAISARAMQALTAAVPTAIETLSGGDPTNVSAKLVAQAAAGGDKVATEILSDAGRYVGIGVAMVVNLLSPALVILGGGVAQSGQPFLDAVCMTVERRAYTTIVNKPTIITSALREDASVLGAAALVLDWAFQSSDSPLVRALA